MDVVGEVDAYPTVGVASPGAPVRMYVVAGKAHRCFSGKRIHGKRSQTISKAGQNTDRTARGFHYVA